MAEWKWNNLVRLERGQKTVTPGNGRRATWRKFRYGDKPSSKRIPLKRLLNTDERKNIVSQVAEILDDFQQTPFEHEASCRHGLRSAFCLQGHGWALAENEATLLVEEALKKIGAQRPTWEEGQRYFPDSRAFCSWCQKPMHDAQGRFCSKECSRAFLTLRIRKDEHEIDATTRAARKLIVRMNRPLTACSYCGTQFHQHSPNQKYCCHECSQRSRTKTKEYACLECGVKFQQVKSAQKFCSIECSRKHERPKSFEGTCEWCFAPFTAQHAYARCCSQKCSKAYASFKSGKWIPKRLSAPIFDYYFGRFRPDFQKKSI